MCVRESVCERERVRLCVCVCARERTCVCVCVREREAVLTTSANSCATCPGEEMSARESVGFCVSVSA